MDEELSMLKFLVRIFYIFLYRQNAVKASKKLGVKIGENCRLVGKVSFGSEPYLIKLGNHVSITQSSFITHDGGVWVFREELPKIDFFAPITVGNNVFIGSNCIIMPGVNIGDNVVVGAGSIVTKSLESNGIYAGVPARKIKTLEEYRKKIEENCFNTKGLSRKEKREHLQKYFGNK
jgi:acetyltransferase-like isoleucine patch superfamily enzyme